MKKHSIVAPIILLLGSLVLTSCGGEYSTYPVTGEYMTGKTAKSVYKAYLGSAPTTLNQTLSQNASDVMHIANISSTLVMNDNYGILRKTLATKATKTSDNKKFIFELRDDVPWVKSDGTIYQYKNVDQYVKAEDFVFTAKTILDYNTQSEIYYMYTLFINNAWEYYCYTMMAKFIADQKEGYRELKGDYAAQAKKLTELIKEYSGHEPDEIITASDITKIANFERVGVQVVKEDGKKDQLVYTLRSQASFFPTMLAYGAYTPLHERFYKSVGQKTGYGTTADKTLYCGAFRITEFKSTSLKYEKNKYYFDADKVHIDKVNYTVLSANASTKDLRESFERKDVDGFSLDSKDDIGWKEYITGPDGTGTIENPYSDLVNSRELDDVSYTYHYSIDINRSTEEASYSDATYWDTKFKGLFQTSDEKKAVIENTNLAVKIAEVRKLILNAFDINIYNSQFTPEANQYQINTFTPRGYVYDESGKDYVEYYYDEYAEKRGLKDSAEAKSLVGPQQISGVQFLEGGDSEEDAFLAKYPWLSLKTLREDAINAVTQANKSIGLKLPVVVDFLASGGINSENTIMETQLVQSWNERANACTINKNRVSESLPLCSGSSLGEGHYPYFEMVANSPTSSTDYETASNNGYYTVNPGWGWVGDYADPLTYMHTYRTNGEMSKMSGNTDNFDNYSLVNGVLTKSSKYMFDDYNALVDEASEITTSNYERYAKFAEAEYMLLNDIHIIKPSYMSTQGWVASVSRACGYENPSAPYGLADSSLVGIWVLEDVPTGKERAAARELQNTKKVAELAKYDNDTIKAIFVDN